MNSSPNILFITTDQQSADMMSCAGNSLLRTPNMDRIASWGTRVEHAYTSNPVCSPARFCWYTGRMPSSIQLRKNGTTVKHLPEEVHKGGLGNILRQAGYSTAFGGKQHFPADSTATTLGFDDYEEDERDRLAEETAEKILSFPRDKPWMLAANFINPHDICYKAIRNFQETQEEGKLVSNGGNAIRELDASLASLVDENDCPPLPDNYEIPSDEPEAIRWLVEERPFKKNARQKWGESEWRRHRWAYHRLTERVDEQIGFVLDALEKSGQLENTVIMFTSDHGDHSGAHRLEHKTTFYDESARVPFIIARPGHGTGGQVSTKWIVNAGIDLMATCCDIAGVEQPAWNLGHSLLPLIEDGERADGPTGTYVESQLGFMWATRDHKYIRYDICGDEEVLYDRVADRGEMSNWISDPTKKDVVMQHREALDTAMDQHQKLQLVLE